VAGGKQIVLAAVSALPHGADRVDHPARRKVARGCGLGFTRLAAAVAPALLENRRPAGTVDRAVDAAPAEE
jgi:hypothetical protein